MSNKPAPKYQKCRDNEWTHWPSTPQNRYEWSFKSMCHEYSSNRQWKLNYYTEVSYFREIINIYCLREPTYIWIWWGNKKINAWMLKWSLHENTCRQSRSEEENNVNDLDPSNDDGRDGAPITESRIQLWKKMSHIVLWGACHNSSRHASPV